MKKSWIVAILVLSIIVSTAFADEASHKKTALKLLEITNAEKMLEQVMAYIETMMEQQFDELGLPPEGQEAVKEVEKELMEWFSEFFVWEKMRDMYIDIYVEVFTEDELNELIEFYQSPLGKKLLEKTPELMQKSMEKTQVVFQEKMPEFQKRLEKTILELEEKYKQ